MDWCILNSFANTPIRHYSRSPIRKVLSNRVYSRDINTIGHVFLDSFGLEYKEKEEYGRRYRG